MIEIEALDLRQEAQDILPAANSQVTSYSLQHTRAVQ
jgi:hypothetical protein